MGAPVVHWEINSNNAKELKDFYAELFGWRVLWNDEWGYGLVQTEAGRGVDGGIGQPREEPFITFYVEVDDFRSIWTRPSVSEQRPSCRQRKFLG